MAEMKKQLGQLLIDAGKLDSHQLEEALEYKDIHGMYLGKAILALGFLSERDLTDILSEQLGIPTLDLMVYEVEQKILEYIKEDFARKNKVMPLFALGESLTIAISDPMNLEIIDDLSLDTGMEINIILATESDIEQAIDMYYSAAKYAVHTQNEDGTVDDRSRVVSKEIGGDTEVVAAVNLLFGEAIKVGASDIHFEPREKDVRIRFRVDGVLQQYYTVPKESMNPLISRLKILADSSSQI
jgi:type IV pilus assembly protein PilB